MYLATVVGTIVAPVAHEFYTGEKLLLLQPEGPDGKPSGKVTVGIDRAQAGEGDKVLVMAEGSSAREIVGDPGAPVRTVVVGVVDHVELEGKLVYTAGERRDGSVE
jgi:ethanolamine utilization protein EutN